MKLVPEYTDRRINLLIFLTFLSAGIDNYIFARQSVTFSAAGDVMLDRGVRRKIEKEGLDYPFALVAGYFQSKDIVFCNLECPISSIGNPLDKYYTFRADDKFLPVLKNAGFNVISLANNHTLDYGREALTETISNIKSIGSCQVGAGRSRLAASLPLLIRRNGIRFAFFASNQIGIQGIDKDTRRPSSWDAPVDEIIRMIKIVRPFVDFVVVSVHWGIEFSDVPLKRQIRDAHSIMDAGADILIGHHSHSIMGVEVYKGKYILYSLGNFLFDQHQPPGNTGMLFECTFTSKGIKDAALIPTVTKKCRPNIPNEIEYQDIIKRIESVSSEFDVAFLERNGKLYLKSKANRRDDAKIEERKIVTSNQTE